MIHWILFLYDRCLQRSGAFVADKSAWLIDYLISPWEISDK